MSKKPFVLNHPLANVYLAKMRDKNTCNEQFRAAAQRLTYLLAVEVLKTAPTSPKQVETPLEKTTEAQINGRVAIVPILRAGLAMEAPFLHLIPEAEVRHLGYERDEKTHEPVAYYNKLAKASPPDIAYVVDPMLATGGSAKAAIDALKEWGVKKIVFVGLIGAPEGVKALQEHTPNCEIYLGALDRQLNENAYILPGLGDAGDRVFNT